MLFVSLVDSREIRVGTFSQYAKVLTRCALSLLVSKTAAKNDEILTSVLVMYAAYGVNTLLYGSIMKDIPTEVATY